MKIFRNGTYLHTLTHDTDTVTCAQALYALVTVLCISTGLADPTFDATLENLYFL